MKYVHFIILISVMILLASCVDVDTKSDGTSEVKLPGGGKITHNESGLEMPEDFPEDIALYPKAKLTAVFGSPLHGTAQLTFESEATIKEVTAFFKEKLKENEWQTTGVFQTGESTMMQGTKGGTRGLSIVVSKHGKTGKTVISMTTR